MKWSISEKFLAAFFSLLTFREKGNRRMGESSLAIAMFNLGELSRESNERFDLRRRLSIAFQHRRD